MQDDPLRRGVSPVYLRIVVFACALSSGASAVAGSPPAATREEIAHLLAYLESSGCAFFRNGTWHDAIEARAHLEKKYEHLRKRSLIQTADDFIEKAATSSSISGKDYLVRCQDGPAVPSGLWLRAELERFRSTHAPDGQCKTAAGRVDCDRGASRFMERHEPVPWRE